VRFTSCDLELSLITSLDGHYLNLPVVEDDGRLVAIVDVLKLTYATLEQMNAMATENSTTDNQEGGPMWGRFFDSLGHDEDGSVLSGSMATGSAFPTTPGSMRIASPQSEVHPNDSASVIDDEGSVLESYAQKRGIQVPTGALAAQADDGTYVFKFRTPSGRTHRFQSRHDDIQHLREIVAGKLAIDPFFTQHAGAPGEEVPDPNDFHLSYTDEDGDSVLMTTDSDVADAVKIARTTKTERVVLCIQGGKGWIDAGDKTDAKAAEVNSVALQEVKAIEKTEEVAVEEFPPLAPQAPTPQLQPSKIGHGHAPPDEIFGIPKDLLLPASIGALAAVIVGVFAISRMTSSNHY
jgi:PB1 domain